MVWHGELNFFSLSDLVTNSLSLFLPPAPAGCLQYFTSPSGTLESFNFRDSSSPYPILLDYAICIKRQSGYCGLTIAVATEGDGARERELSLIYYFHVGKAIFFS